MKDKIIIGILPTLIGNDTNDYFQEKETFVRNYGNRLSEYNATPIGIILDKEQVPISTLELCDGFILPGGIVLKEVGMKPLIMPLNITNPY